MAQDPPACAVCTFNSTPNTHWEDGSKRVKQLISSPRVRIAANDISALEDDEVVVRARLAELDALIFDARSALQRLVDTRAEVAATVNDFVTVHSPECKRLRIQDVCCGAHVPIAFPRLSSLGIIYSYSATPTRVNDIIQAPWLDFYEEVCACPWDAVLVAFNPTQLRQYKIRDFCPDRIPLLNLSSITTLTLEQLSNPKIDGFRGELHFPSVRKLRLVCSDTYEILGYTTMPNLEALELCTEYCFTNNEDEDTPLCTLLTFASPPNNLTKLEISHASEYGCHFLEALPQLFAATKNVSDLRLFLQPRRSWKGRTEDARVDILDARHGLLPRLQTLWLGNAHVVRKGMTALKKTMTSRRGRLEHFGVLDVPGGLMTRWDEKHLTTLKSELESSKRYIDLGMEILI